MYSYAQTNIQLFNQLQRQGYSKEDLVSISNTYELAMRLFTGRYRPSGKTFIAHVVGTASILASLKVPIKVVAAGLIHSIYAHGDFGTWTKGISNAKREQVRSVVGEEVEEYLYRYAALQWNSRNILAIRDRYDDLDPIDRDVLLIRLADQLEDNLDLGIVYCSYVEEGKNYIHTMGSIMLEMAEKLGFPTLAVELEKAFKETISAEQLGEICKQNRGKYSFSIAPKSYYKKLSVAVFQELARGVTYLRSELKRMRNKLRSLYYSKSSRS